MMSEGKTRRTVLRSAGLAGLAGFAGCSGVGSGGSGSGYEGQTLNILTWEGYGGVAEMIKQETGAETNVKLISSDREGFNTLQGGGTEQFDVLVLDNQWAQRNARAETIVPLEREDYPVAMDGNIIDKFGWPYDTFGYDGEQWATAPRWGWEGMGYHDDKVELSELKSRGYEVIWDSEYDTVAADAPTSVIPLVVLQLFDLGEQNPMRVELSDSQLQTLEDTLVEMFDNVNAIHQGAAALRQSLLDDNAEVVLGVGNFELSQLPAEGHDWAKVMVPPDVGGWYWTEGITLVNNPDLDRELANEFINACLSPEGQYSICWDGAKSKGAPANTAAFDEFSEEEQRTIMMYEGKGFEAADELLNGQHQYLISPQQERWTEIWERAKAESNL